MIGDPAKRQNDLEKLAELLVPLRADGAYEDDWSWRGVDELLTRLGYDVGVESWRKVRVGGHAWNPDTLQWEPDPSTPSP